jgi:glycine dehydrogenase
MLRFALRLGRLANQRARFLQSRGLATLKPVPSLFAPLDTFSERHIGPDDAETSKMLSQLGYESMDAFVAETVPPKIRVSIHSIDNTTIPPYSESQLHARAKQLGGENKPFKSYIGMGYHSAVVPPVILRNVSSDLLPHPLTDTVKSSGNGKSRMVYPIYPIPTGNCSRHVQR